MFAYLHNAFHVSTLSSTKHSNKTCQCSGSDCSLFGDLFMPIQDDLLNQYLEKDIPEFNLEGFQEEDKAACPEDSQSPGSRKLSRELASTEDADQSASISEETPSVSSEIENQIDLFSESKSTTSLKKRNPKNEEEIQSLVSKLPQPAKEVDFNEFDVQALNRSRLVGLIVKLIDRESLHQREVDCLDEDSLQLLSNFAFMIYGIEFKASSITDSISKVNEKMVSTKEKKKRNEERIKYVFKRINKLLLKRFMFERDLPAEFENVASTQVLNEYFGSAISNDSTKRSCNSPSYERYFTMLFKPSNMYRNDLKEVFSFKPYLEIFRDILSNEFLTDFKVKRASKVESYLVELRNEIFYCSDKSDPTILQKKISRLPWSISEVKKGMDLFSDVFKTI